MTDQTPFLNPINAWCVYPSGVADDDTALGVAAYTEVSVSEDGATAPVAVVELAMPNMVTQISADAAELHAHQILEAVAAARAAAGGDRP